MTNTMTPEAVSSLKAINTGIKGVSSAYGKARDKAQEVGLLIIAHARAYGDCTAAVKLARAVPARERNSLIGWFSLFSPIGIQMGNTSKDDKVRFIKKESKNFNDFNLDGAKANPWYDDPAGANPEPKPLNTLADFHHIVSALLKKAIKDADKDDKYTAEARDEVKREAEDLLKMFGTYHAKRVASKAEGTVTDPAEAMKQAANG